MYLFVSLHHKPRFWISENPFPNFHFQANHPWRHKQGNNRDNAMHSAVSGSVRKWLWIPETIFRSAKVPRHRRGSEAGEGGSAEPRPDTVSVLSEWKSSRSLYCRKAFREMWMLAFSFGHVPQLSSSLSFWLTLFLFSFSNFPRLSAPALLMSAGGKMRWDLRPVCSANQIQLYPYNTRQY